MKAYVIILSLLALTTVASALSEGEDLLYGAIEDDDKDQVEAVLNKYFTDVRYRDITFTDDQNGISNLTILHLVGEFGSLEVLKWLNSEFVENIADYKPTRLFVDAVDSSKRTPLFYAAKNKAFKGSKTFNVLLDMGADVLQRDVDGLQPIHIAILAKRIINVKKLAITSKKEQILASEVNGLPVAHYMAANNFVEAFNDREFHRFFNAQALDGRGQHPICHAAINGTAPFAIRLAKSVKNALNDQTCFIGSTKRGTPVQAAAYLRQIDFIRQLICQKD